MITQAIADRAIYWSFNRRMIIYITLGVLIGILQVTYFVATDYIVLKNNDIAIHKFNDEYAKLSSEKSRDKPKKLKNISDLVGNIKHINNQLGVVGEKIIITNSKTIKSYRSFDMKINMNIGYQQLIKLMQEIYVIDSLCQINKLTVTKQPNTDLLSVNLVINFYL